MKITRKLLLEEAAKRYPIGTKIICLGNGSHCVVNRHPYFYCSENSLAGANERCVLYRKGKWAKIVNNKIIEIW